MFENRVAVGKSTLGGIQAELLARDQIHGIQRIKAVLQLQPIGANVLHRRCAHGAGDQRHVLKARIAL